MIQSSKSYYNLFFKIIFIALIIISQAIQSQSIVKDIELPQGFKRIVYSKNSFADWIRNLPLKNKDANVLDYKGRVFKSREDTSVAGVVDWPVQGKRLEQCIDIIIRFYSEYLWKNNRSEELILPLPGGSSIKWKDWQNGFRPKFSGINFKLIKSGIIDSSKSNFNKFLNLVFAESHTQQFYHSYPKIATNNIQVGDFIVKKGAKGHAVLIVDLAKNENDDFVALFGQGDTPACEFYLLNYKKDDPWIPLNFSREVVPLPIKKKMTWDGLRRFE